MSKCKYFDLDMSANGGLDFQENSGMLDLFFSIDKSFSLNIFAIVFLSQLVRIGCGQAAGSLLARCAGLGRVWAAVPFSTN
jgi:hypothetical protein